MRFPPNRFLRKLKIGQGIYCCEHYLPGIIPSCSEKEISNAHTRTKKSPRPAKSLLVEFDNCYICSKCELILAKEEAEKIQAVVDYLNCGGNDRTILSSLFRGVTVGDVIYLGKNHYFTQGAQVSLDYQPHSNYISV